MANLNNCDSENSSTTLEGENDMEFYETNSVASQVTVLHSITGGVQYAIPGPKPLPGADVEGNLLGVVGK